MRLRQLSIPAALFVVVGVAAPAMAGVSVNQNYIQGDGANDNITVSCTPGGLLTATGAAAPGAGH